MAANNVRTQNQNLASSIQGKLHQQSPLRAHHSIFRIPNVLREGNEKIYVPHLLSVGPFHRGLNLTMEGIKLWYLHCLLERNPTPNTGLEYFVEAIRNIEQYCRDCYVEEIGLSSDEFVEMMLVDGCFIIELFRKFSEQVPIKDDDPVFCSPWICTTLINDLLLLENQLPWRVLNTLFDLTCDTTAGNYPLPLSLPELTLRYFKCSLGICPRLNGALENKHLLDFIRNSLLGSYAGTEFEPIIWSPIPSVFEMVQAGVFFQRGKEDDMLNITFKNGVIKIPPIKFYKNGESLFRNLIAYEQSDCASTSKCKITSYAVLLSHLFKSERDVEFLIDRGIIENWFGGDVAWLLNSSRCNDVEVYNFSYAELYNKVNAYRRNRFNKWKFLIRRDYFNEPWAVLNFTTAVVMVTVLTMIQTVYSVLSYNKPG